MQVHDKVNYIANWRATSEGWQYLSACHRLRVYIFQQKRQNYINDGGFLLMREKKLSFSVFVPEENSLVILIVSETFLTSSVTA